MTPASTRKKSGAEHRYYRCSTRNKAGRSACTARSLPAKAIEDFVVERLREATADGNLAADLQRKFQGRVQGQRQSLLTERRELPRASASLSAEGRNLVVTLGQATGTAHRLLEERIEDIGEQLAVHERRLVEVERALTALDETELEAGWVAESLAHFDAVWDAMTLENQGRIPAAPPWPTRARELA